MIEFTEPGSRPGLVAPVMVAAFEGWNDAGDAASEAVAHLAQVWQARALGAMDPEDYYDFQVNRPEVTVDGDGVRHVEWPTTRLSVVRAPEGGRDLVLVHGIEPSLRWRSYVGELLDLAREFGVELVLTLGALLADTPHTRPVPVTGTSTDPALAETMGYEPSRYEGPTGIVGVLQDACAGAGVAAVSLWAAVPHYAAAPPCPKATVALLRGVEDVLDLPVPLGDLPEEARAWQDGVEQLAADDEEVAAYVRALEDARATTDLPEASGEAIAREFERFLRRRSTE